MILVSLPGEEKHYGEYGRRLVFYLAMEEYIGIHLDRLSEGLTPPGEARELFFMWQVDPTVIFGRNQVMEAEVNMKYCRAHGVQMYRRKSGGGCVYADKGNIMFSYVTDSTDVAFTFDKYLQRVALALRHLGLPAERSGRNDILIDGRKVSGNAFTLRPQCSIVHGTMLFDSDFDALTEAITPSEGKIRSKGVDSVRQHVTNIAGQPGWNMGIEEFKRRMILDLCDKKVELTEEDVAEIEKIEAGYLDPSFLEGRNHRFSVERRGKIEGAGEFAVDIELAVDEIVKVAVSGDYFLIDPGRCDDLGALLTERLSGVRYDRGSVTAALKETDLGALVLGLNNENFIGLFTDNQKYSDI